MAVSNENELVDALARDIITQIAPEELLLYQSISEEYFNNPQKLLDEPSKKDEMLGFGVGEAAALLTPIVLGVTAAVVKYIGDEIRKSVQEESSTLIGEWVKKFFKIFRSSEDKEIPALTSSQLEQVRDVAYRQARQLKLSEQRAELLADAVVGSLAVSEDN